MTVNPSGTAVSHSSRYPADSVSQNIAVDDDGRVRVASSTHRLLAPLERRSQAAALRGDERARGGGVLFGTQLGPASAVVAGPGADGRMPTALGGAQVFFDGIAAPLLYVSQEQINTVAPFGLSVGKEIAIRVVVSGGTTTLPCVSCGRVRRSLEAL